MTEMFRQLAAPFAPEQVRWRAQQVYLRDGKASAMALCFIDARDVQNRLDEVCGPDGWKNSFVETAAGRCICTLSLRIGDEWIGKADGAGNTDVEAEKGGLSDALKRSAVMWGIGRYLYSIEAVWADCEVVMKDGKPTMNKAGKPIFKKWTPRGIAALNAAAGSYVAPIPPKDDRAEEPEPLGDEQPESVKMFLDGMEKAHEAGNLAEYWMQHVGTLDKAHLPYVIVRKDELKAKQQKAA